MFGIRRHILKSSPLALVPLLFLTGAIVMLFFCLLAGLRDHNPLNRVFFLKADTSNIPGAPALTHFTMNNACDQRNGISFACRGHRAASPMLPQEYFQTSTGVPASFTRHPDKYFYLSRFTYAFYIITIFWVLLAALLNLAALLSTGATLAAAIVTAIALLSCAFLAAIMTAVYVMAQNAFRASGRFARVGVKAFAFTWTSLVLIALALLALLALWYYRHQRDRTTEAISEKPRTRQGSMMSGLLSRRGRHHHSHDTGKRASYDSSFYNDDIHRDERGVASARDNYTTRDTYTNRAGTAVGGGAQDTYTNRPSTAVGGGTPLVQDAYTTGEPYTNRPGAAVGRDGMGVYRNDHTEERGTRRFTGNIGDDYTTPGARSSGGYVAYSPSGAHSGLNTTTSPVQLNTPGYQAGVTRENTERVVRA